MNRETYTRRIENIKALINDSAVLPGEKQAAMVKLELMEERLDKYIEEYTGNEIDVFEIHVIDLMNFDVCAMTTSMVHNYHKKGLVRDARQI